MKLAPEMSWKLENKVTYCSKMIEKDSEHDCWKYWERFFSAIETTWIYINSKYMPIYLKHWYTVFYCFSRLTWLQISEMIKLSVTFKIWHFICPGLYRKRKKKNIGRISTHCLWKIRCIALSFYCLSLHIAKRDEREKSNCAFTME